MADEGAAKYLTEPEVARLLRESLWTLREHRRRGLAPPHIVKPGGRRIYPADELVRWLEARRNGSAAPQSAA